MRWITATVIAMLLVAACEASTPSGTETPTPTLGTNVPTLGASVPELIVALGSDDPAIRLEAAQHLATVGDASAVPALAEATSDDDSDVALAAIGALASIGGEPAVDALAALTTTLPDLLDDDGEQRFEATVTALGEIGSASAVTRLLELKVAEDQGTWWSDALHQTLDAFDRADVSAISSALNHEDTAVRLEAIKRLGAVGGPVAVTTLIGQVGSKTTDVRAAAIDALGTAGDPKATATLVKALANDDIFAAATAALVKIHSHDAAPLLAYLKSKSTVKVYLALIRIGQKGTEGALATALTKYGDKEMAVDYLNCGNPTLEKAAHTWASKHGYTVVTVPGGASVTWGED